MRTLPYSSPLPPDSPPVPWWPPAADWCSQIPQPTLECFNRQGEWVHGLGYGPGAGGPGEPAQGAAVYKDPSPSKDILASREMVLHTQAAAERG